MRPGRLTVTMALTVMAALAVAGLPPYAGAATFPVPPNALVTDGRITNLATLGNVVYATGVFHRIGRFTGSGVALDLGSGAVNQSFPSFNGQISYVLADGSGGWYVGGNFSEIGGAPHRGLVHLLSDGMLDPAFAASTNGLVDSIVLNGNQLIIGGFFDHVDGVKRTALAAVDARTGSLLGLAPHFDGNVTELALLGATSAHAAVLYAGTGDTLTALDPSTGRAIPGFSFDPGNGSIEALAATDRHLYVGGDGLIAAVDPMTGAPDSRFNPLPSGRSLNGSVETIVAQSTRILVGGSFNALGGAAGPLVALDPDTGVADPGFSPQIDGTVYDMDQTGNVLWIGGKLKSVGGAPATNVSAIDATTGARDGDVNPPPFDDQVNAVRASGSAVYAGGKFSMAGFVRRHGFAAFQARSLALDPIFDPPSPASKIITADGGHLVAARFQFQGYTPDAPGLQLPWYPSTHFTVQVLDPATGRPLRAFRQLQVHNLSGVTASRNQLFIARRLESNVRFPHNVVTVYDIRTGAVRHRWQVPLIGYISHLATAAGRLYAAGSFKRTRPSGQRANLAILALNPNTGRLDSAFDPHAHGPVYGMTARGSKLYFAGLFDQVQGQRRPSLAAVSLSSGSLASGFRPQLSSNQSAVLVNAPGVISINQFPNDTFGDWFYLNPATGRIDRSAAQGFRSSITATSAEGRNVTVAVHFDATLIGDDNQPLDFVRPLSG